MSELVRDDVSTESLCTVIENITGNDEKETTTNLKKNNNIDYKSENENCSINLAHDYTRPFESTEDDEDVFPQSSSSLNYSTEENCDTTSTTNKSAAAFAATVKPRTKLKKSVSFDPNDEKIRKFITGEPIVDQKNPFKSFCSNGNGHNSSLKKKRTPPPVPTKRSTLSVRKTVTQQLREREREKEKERERLKNETNQRNTNGNSSVLSSPDEFVTTEEVLKQSKYVKTYIKNPDPYFVYDPTVLARIKFEELRDLKKPPKKLKLSMQTKDRLKDLKNKPSPHNITISRLPFKKCSKPNYPELADIKVKVGTESDGNYFNPVEVSKNAKKFDDRVKKLQIGSDDDLDEIDGPLTKSESSDELPANSNQKDTSDKDEDLTDQQSVMNGSERIEEQQPQEPPIDGTFTNTINSKEFQQYLDKKGLSLIPAKIPNGARSVYTTPMNSVPKPTTNNHISFRAPESVKISINAMDSPKSSDSNSKKPSVFQRLLANSIFASRRKTMPKETVPTPRSLLHSDSNTKENGGVRTPAAIKRVVLERQSFHGRPRASNLLSASEANYLKNQGDRSRKSFASGDDLSISISSALTNAEYDGSEVNLSTNPTIPMRCKPELLPKPIVKPPRRTLSRDRLGNSHQQPQLARQLEQNDAILKPKVQRPQISVSSSFMYSLPRETKDMNGGEEPTNDALYFRRTLERQSLIPKRTTQTHDKRQVFGRSASMDRNEILKRTASRGLQGRTKSASLKVPPPLTSSKENLREHFNVPNGPKLTSTPIRNTSNVTISMPTYDGNLEKKTFVPIAKPPAGAYVDQQEWDKLRAIKERTDRELYYRVLQQQQLQQLQQQQSQQRQVAENIYEHLQPNQILVTQPLQHQSVRHQQPTLIEEDNFVRSSPQRNTFSGVIRNRQAKIIDGRAVLMADQNQVSQQRDSEGGFNNTTDPYATARSQSVLDGMTLGGSGRIGGIRRGYESDTDATPVVLRRKNAPAPNDAQTQPRRIGGILTREEILQKVKEFCRKSLNKTPTPSHPQMQAIYEKQAGSTDLSPVSYASVETHQRPGFRMYAAPQVPQRMQSLPEQFIPITSDPNATISSPIYAHVVKRSSLQSNQSELYDSPQQQQQQRQYIVRRESDAQSIYMGRGGGGGGVVGTLQRPESAIAPTPMQYLIVDGDKLVPAQLVNYYPASDLYAQPQYVRPHQIQPIPGAYGYITVREPPLMPPQHQQVRHQRLHDGRSTPLILDRSSQQASQIYWTPQHQRLQQHAELLPFEISPRYMLKQTYPALGPRPVDQQKSNRATKMMNNSNIPNSEKFSTIQSIRTNTPTKQINQPHRQAPLSVMTESNAHPQAYEWESGSETGEVQRIMERQRNSGESKTRNSLYKNLKTKMSRLVGSSKR